MLRKLFASLGLGRTFDRLSRVVPKPGDIGLIWRCAWPPFAWFVGICTALVGIGRGHYAVVTVGIVLMGLGPAGAIELLSRPPEGTDDDEGSVR